MKNMIFIALTLFGVVTVTPAHAAPILTLVDTISVVDRDYFNGFEGLPATFSYGSAYLEDSILIEQINGQANDIWTTYLPGMEGSRAWYPNGGDNGLTRNTRAGGAEFGNIGLLAGSGGGGQTVLYYELRLLGAVIATGQVAHTVTGHYLGFLGGGFDEILLRDGPLGTSVWSGTLNALVIDSIELQDLAVPEPTSALLFGIAGLVVTLRLRPKHSPDDTL